jgi:preprotein translocase subunit SecG
MTIFAALLTFVLILNCLLLILLVLVQLPKKDAGAGMAFGGGSADALFGAGSGIMLTKITKWAIVSLLAFALILGYLMDKNNRQGNSSTFEKEVQQKQAQKSIGPTPGQPAAAPSPSQQPAPTSLPAATPAATNVPAAK